jgi:regulatory protein
MAWAVFQSSDGAFATTVSKTEPSLRAQAMRFLARREHSRAELRRKLAPRVPEGEDLDALLDDLAKRGWLSDARFAEQSIRSHARRFGPLKLAQQLRSRGVDDDTIAAGFRAAGDDGASSLENVWRSRFRAPPADEREKAKQVRFLQGRGFALDDIFRFLKQKP